MKNLKITASYIKILETVEWLNNQHYYPLEEGIFKIITGANDDETKKYKKCPSYGTLISFGSKKVCRFTMMLIRYGYLTRIYHKESNQLYLSITDLGLAEIVTYRKTHKRAFRKKEVLEKPTIVKID